MFVLHVFSRICSIQLLLLFESIVKMFIIVLLNLLLAVNVYGVSSLTGDAMRLFISPSCSSVFFSIQAFLQLFGFEMLSSQAVLFV